VLARARAGGAPAAEPLGRLFFTPEQRDQLDRPRAAQKARALDSRDRGAGPGARDRQLPGVMRRSDGRNTVWINDRAIDDGRRLRFAAAGARTVSGSIVLELPADRAQGSASRWAKASSCCPAPSGKHTGSLQHRRPPPRRTPPLHRLRPPGHDATSMTRIPVRQRGQALLLVLVLLGVGITAFVYNFVSPAALAIEREKATHAALAQARDALIGYAAINTGRAGALPCPDASDNGTQQGSCGLPANRVGRLPWKSLGLPDLRDGSGERLWYAVSERYTNSPIVGTLNSLTPAEYTVDGASAIAIVFAPGPLVAPQVRDTANKFNIANYLEGENANGDAVFTASGVNDRLLVITHDTLFPAVEMRVARQVRQVLLEYFAANSYLPFANDYSGALAGCVPSSGGRVPRDPSDCGQHATPWVWPLWFFGHDWHEIVYYAVAPACTSYSGAQCDGAGGLLTVDGATDIRAIVMAPGTVLAGQNRPCAAVADCLEDAENVNGDSVYVKPMIGPSVNDRLVVVSP
jgi:type II secretory pathway pseudopilin PulG